MQIETRENQTAPLVTLTLFGYNSGTAKLWAFGQMATAGRQLARTEGLKFFKLLGSGNGGGFSLAPNWARYGLLCSWTNADSADEFFANSKVFRNFRAKAEEVWTVRLQPIKSHGNWSGQNPFLPVAENPNENKPLAVLTRATINLKKLKRFWGFVPGTSRELNESSGLIKSIGIGEAPFFRQATFSLWQSEAAMRDFAYKSPIHKQVVKLTRQENWYKEELFARFAVISSEGTWDGRNPLAEFL